MQWEVVIGLETHVQLSTRSKIFSGAARHFGDEPNVNACYVDLALPGSLPVLNHSAVEKAIRFGLAIDATVANIPFSTARTTSTLTCPRATDQSVRAAGRPRWQADLPRSAQEGGSVRQDRQPDARSS